MGDNNLSFKFIAKRDFDTVKAKYSYFEISKEKVESIIAKADPLDVLALTITPGSGLKIVDVKILNENTEDVFMQLLKDGPTISKSEV